MSNIFSFLCIGIPHFHSHFIVKYISSLKDGALKAFLTSVKEYVITEINIFLNRIKIQFLIFSD